MYLRLCYFLVVFVFENVFATDSSKNVSLEVLASVDPIVSAEIISENTTINVSELNETLVRVTYNGVKSVEVTINSENAWNLVPSDRSNTDRIPYYCICKKHKIDGGKFVLSFDDFKDCFCDLKLSFMLENPNLSVTPDDYSDTIRISVTEVKK